MKKPITYLLMFIIVLLTSCYKDKGNYKYLMPEEPIVMSLDTVYSVFVGDSLIIDPGVEPGNGKENLMFDWKISVPERLSYEAFSGPQLRMVFGLGPKRYYARLTISDLNNNMKYFYDFAIDGKTAFSKGIVVLSEEDGIGRLSFVKPNGDVQPRLYETIQNEILPTAPVRLIAVSQAYNPSVINSYWMVFDESENPGIQLDANTMQRIQYLKDNFFDPPATIKVGSLQSNFFGVITGVINGGLYAGTTSTWDQSPLYGMFGLPSPGDYVLSPNLIFNFNPSTNAGYYIGFEKNRRQFLRFNLYGTPNYFGIDYNVIGDAFDPKNMGMDLLHMEQINGNDVLVFMKSGDGIIYECKFGINFNGPFQITPIYQHEFKLQELFTGNERIVASQTGVFYISMGNKIYRYNPLNEDVQVLNPDLGGKDISMLKIVDEDVLIVGTNQEIYFLDISTGHFGNILQKLSGLPGNVIDLVIRN